MPMAVSSLCIECLAKKMKWIRLTIIDISTIELNGDKLVCLFLGQFYHWNRNEPAYSLQAEKERRLKEKNQANTKKFMDERKNTALKQNKKREKQKKLHETQLQEIINYIKSVSSSYESLSQFFG